MSHRSIDRTAQVEKINQLHPSTSVRGGAKLTGDITTDENVYIDFNVVLVGPVKLGRGTYIGPNAVLGHPTAEELKSFRASTAPSQKAPTVLGEDCIVRSGCTLYSNTKVGDSVSFGHNVLVREAVTIGKRTKVGTNVVVDGYTSIGSMVSIQSGVYICTNSTIEDGVFLGPCCVFTNDKYLAQVPTKLVGPTVKRGASIGANALLFPDLTVGEDAIVGAQALVVHDVPPRTIFTGVPAKKLRDKPREWHSTLLTD